MRRQPPVGGTPSSREAAPKFNGPDYVHPDYLYLLGSNSPKCSPSSPPGKLAVSYRSIGGTESVEGALQIAMAYTGSFKGKATIHGEGFAIGIEIENSTYAAQIGETCPKTACSSPPKKTSS